MWAISFQLFVKHLLFHSTFTRTSIRTYCYWWRGLSPKSNWLSTHERESCELKRQPLLAFYLSLSVFCSLSCNSPTKYDAMFLVVHVRDCKSYQGRRQEFFQGRASSQPFSKIQWGCLTSIFVVALDIMVKFRWPSIDLLGVLLQKEHCCGRSLQR